MRRAFFLLFGLVSCAHPLAQIQITDVRMFYGAEQRLVVDTDVRAVEAGGDNVGRYCVATTFPGETVAQRVCYDDLTDGDERTVRLVSQGKINPGGSFTIEARIANVTATEVRVAPQLPK